jgi:hypothetical protein
MPIKRPAASPAPPDPATALAPYRDQLGHVSDAELAALAQVSVETVRAYRIEAGIKRYRRAPVTGRTVAQAPSPAPAGGRRGPPAAPQATPAAAPRVSAPSVRGPTTSTATAPPTASPLDAFRSRIGKEGDGIIAAEAGVNRYAVVSYRHKHGIPAYDGYRWAKGRSPSVGKGPTTLVPAAALVSEAGSGADEGRAVRETPVVVAPAVEVSAPRAAVAAAPPAAPDAAPPSAPSLQQAWRVVVVRGEERRTILVVAPDLPDALARTMAALGSEWTVKVAKLVGEGVG